MSVRRSAPIRSFDLAAYIDDQCARDAHLFVMLADGRVFSNFPPPFPNRCCARRVPGCSAAWGRRPSDPSGRALAAAAVASDRRPEPGGPPPPPPPEPIMAGDELAGVAGVAGAPSCSAATRRRWASSRLPRLRPVPSQPRCSSSARPGAGCVPWRRRRDSSAAAIWRPARRSAGRRSDGDGCHFNAMADDQRRANALAADRVRRQLLPTSRTSSRRRSAMRGYLET
jgi:hypothetical protein